MVGAVGVALMFCVGSSRFDEWLRILCVPGKVVLDTPIVLFRWAVITCMFLAFQFIFLRVCLVIDCSRWNSSLRSLWHVPALINSTVALRSNCVCL